MNKSVENYLSALRSLIGKPYRFWHPGVDWTDIQCMDCGDRAGYNCSAYLNKANCLVGLEPAGGTTDWSNAIPIWEYFNINKNYPPGTILVSPYIDDWDQGHVAVVSTPEDQSRNQWLLQSDFSSGSYWYGGEQWGTPGPNEDWTMAQTQGWSSSGTFVWAGLQQGVPALDGFPGYLAGGKEIALWTAEVMEWFGIPRFYAAMCIATELSTILLEPDDRPSRDIRNLGGYSVPVDAHSQGPFQQQYDWWPFPYDFPTATWSFGAALLKYTAPADFPTTREGAARKIQQVQQSAFADGRNYAENYEWALELVEGTAPGPDPAPPTPDPVDDKPEVADWFGVGEDNLIRMGGDWSKGWIDMDKDRWLKYVPEFQPKKGWV